MALGAAFVALLSALLWRTSVAKDLFCHLLAGVSYLATRVFSKCKPSRTMLICDKFDFIYYHSLKSFNLSFRTILMHSMPSASPTQILTAKVCAEGAYSIFLQIFLTSLRIPVGVGDAVHQEFRILIGKAASNYYPKLFLIWSEFESWIGETEQNDAHIWEILLYLLSQLEEF